MLHSFFALVFYSLFTLITKETRLELKCADLTWPPRYRRTTDEEEVEVNNEDASIFQPQPRGTERGAGETISRVSLIKLYIWFSKITPQ